MSLALHDPDLVGDVDPEAEDRDEFHMEELLKEWTDEPPIRHDVYPESDDEENADGSGRFDTHIRRGDGFLYHKQSFFSGVAFKEAVVDYALRTGCNIKQYRYDSDKIGFICVGCDGKKGGAKCEWKVYAAILKSDNMWKIRKFVDTHSCIPNGECEMFKVPHIARLFVDKIRDSPEFYMPAKIEEIIMENWKISVTRNQCQSARKKALQWIEKEYDDQFARLRDYAAEIVESNKDSRVEVECLTSAEAKPQRKYLRQRFGSDFEMSATIPSPHQHLVGTPTTLPLPRGPVDPVELDDRLLILNWKSGFQFELRVNGF
ncbi:hypothetical protein ISN44_As09g012580 [Arabidopsis suecica]|uniref:Transposase MuDR plant domain-containing protein n=1 Tax=Arabidopsis suecica TaxID=45249 RepID=A0A8T2AG11_ARASU|nr:hypothetical protein ISN44_As09g012580 [Arabidopsis suecica]